MLKYFRSLFKFNSDNKILFSLRAGISTVFVAIFATAVISILLFTSYRYFKILVIYADNLMDEVTIAIEKELSTLLKPLEAVGQLSSLMVRDKIADPDNFPEMVSYTRDLIKALPEASMAHWSNERGSYVIVRRLNHGIDQTEIVDYRDKKPQRIQIYRNDKGEIINKFEIKSLDYDPRQRPWYILAKQQLKPLWTNAYAFYWGGGRKLGISYASPIIKDNKFVGVFSIDINLKTISNFLESTVISKNGKSFIIDDDGNIIAAHSLRNLTSDYTPHVSSKLTNVKSLSDKTVTTAFQYFMTSHQTEFVFKYNNERYYASFNRIPQLANYHWNIAIIIPEKDLTAVLRRNNLVTLSILLGVMLAGLYLIALFSKRISIPFRKLSEDIAKIKFFNIAPSTKLHTRIQEIYSMSNAIESMKIGLQAFRQYVPENLVKQLIYTGEAVKIGGDKREITIFFSDIDNFSTLSEDLAPEKIMEHLCEYFDAMNSVIAKFQGTIDKFIGDGIMAFWGAPIPDQQCILHACLASLECQQLLTVLNKQWKEQEKIVFETRIGIHFGPATVGNLGSSDRINYTAIGDVVNLTSRLEQLNKIYGTKILVTEDIEQAVNQQFIFRIIDFVTVKGRIQPLRIYELISSREIFNAKLSEFCEKYELGFTQYQNGHWDEAIKYFEQALNCYPQDQPCQIIIKRCENFKKNPPPPDWSGVWLWGWQ